MKPRSRGAEVTNKDVKDIRALLQQQKRPEQTVKISLRGDLNAEIVDLDTKLGDIRNELAAHGDGRLNGSAEARKIAERIEELRAEAEEASVLVRLRALGRKEWNDLLAKHPAATKEQEFDPRLFNEAVPACIVEPELDAETMDKFLDALTKGQFDILAGTVFKLNAGEGEVPFSVLASRARQPSDEEPKQPAPTV